MAGICKISSAVLHYNAIAHLDFPNLCKVIPMTSTGRAIDCIPGHTGLPGVPVPRTTITVVTASVSLGPPVIQPRRHCRPGPAACTQLLQLMARFSRVGPALPVPRASPGYQCHRRSRYRSSSPCGAGGPLAGHTSAPGPQLAAAGRAWPCCRGWHGHQLQVDDSPAAGRRCRAAAAVGARAPRPPRRNFNLKLKVTRQ